MIFEIAHTVGMPVYKLLDEMPHEELLKWIEYFNKRPIGWREDDRTYKIMASFGTKEKPWNLFESLAKLREQSEQKEASQNIAKSFTGSQLFQKIRGAKGGERIDV